jgi:hypothetical protein
MSCTSGAPHVRIGARASPTLAPSGSGDPVRAAPACDMSWPDATARKRLRYTPGVVADLVKVPFKFWSGKGLRRRIDDIHGNCRNSSRLSGGSRGPQVE